MPGDRRLRAAVGVVALAVGLALGIVGYRSLRPEGAAKDAGTTSPATPAATSGNREEISVTRPVIRQTVRGRTAWHVQLKDLKVAAGANAISAGGMEEAVIYDKTGTPAIRLTAQQAKGNTADGTLEVSGDVRATTSEGALISTDRLRWIEQERRVHCPGLVTVRARKASMAARDLSYFPDTDIVRVPGLVRFYSNGNKLMGRQLVYNVATETLEMRKVQAILSPRRSQATPLPR
ncbi:MAG: LPS export ABC transporter periplasmic protein LptC [Armatimonadetes bacterium]|nr:LPS export ABC transporter periplasmic protein LptC [Armatimonadota bacterium]